MSCVYLPHKCTHIIKTCLVYHEVLSITRLTRTLLLVSVTLDSELSSDSSFICTHTQLWCFSKRACVCIWCVLQATTVRMGVQPHTQASFRMREKPWYKTRMGELHKSLLTLTLPVLQQHLVMLWLGWMVSYANIYLTYLHHTQHVMEVQCYIKANWSSVVAYKCQNDMTKQL